MLEVFDNDSIRRILRVRRRGCVPSVELRHRLYLTRIPALLVQRRLHWFGHAATTIKADLEPISGPRVLGHVRWRQDWVKVSSELAQYRRAWSASVRDVVNAIGDAGSTRPGDCRRKYK